MKSSVAPVWVEEEEDHFEARSRFFFDQENIPIYESEDSSSATGIGGASRPHKFQKNAKTKGLQENLRQLIASLFKDPSIFTQLNAAFQRLSPEMQAFLGQADPDYLAQRDLWQKSVCRATHLAGLPSIGAMRELIQDSVVQHRCMIDDKVNHHFNTGIIGPRKSGKSTVLALYADQAMLDLAACGDWKHFFVLHCDLKDIMPYANEYGEFYKRFVGIVCDQLEIQCCSIVPWINDIRRYFEAIVSFPIALQLGKGVTATAAQLHLADRILALGREVRLAWQENDSIDWWISRVFSVAVTLPVAVGFSKTLFIIDNIDTARVTVLPADHFARSGPCEVGEHLKHLLIRSDYIFACESLERLYELLGPIDSEGVDLGLRTDFIETFGIENAIPVFDPPLILSLSGELTPFVLKHEYCDGVPFYLSLWTETNRLVDEIFRQPEASDERADAISFAVAQAQAIMNVLFVSDPAKPVRVLGIRRALTGEQAELKAEEARNRVAAEAAAPSRSVSVSESVSS